MMGIILMKMEQHGQYLNKPSKRGFTDKLYFMNLKFAWFYTVACFILTIFSGYLNIMDLSIISVGMPVIWGELGIHTGFIIWKAKAENMKKWNQDNNITM